MLAIKSRRRTMPTLYTMAGTCSLSPNIAAAWLGSPVEIHNIP
jgi:glutathione S-transferase